MFGFGNPASAAVGAKVDAQVFEHVGQKIYREVFQGTEVQVRLVTNQPLAQINSYLRASKSMIAQPTPGNWVGKMPKNII